MVGSVRYTTPLSVNISVKGGLCQIYHATIRPHICRRRVSQIYHDTISLNIRQRRGWVRYTTPPSVQKSRQRRGCVRYTAPLFVLLSFKGGVVSDVSRHYLAKYSWRGGGGGGVTVIPRHHASKYPSKPGLCQIYHATIRQRRVVSYIKWLIRQRRGCVSYTTPLSVQISVKGGVVSDKENRSRGHGEDRESWTRGMTC